MALPHATIEDVSYKEYVISKESVVYVNNCTSRSRQGFVPNPWIFAGVGAIMHDPNIFEDPEVFRPERWFKPELEDERTFDLMFAAGRVSVRLPDGYHLLPHLG